MLTEAFINWMLVFARVGALLAVVPMFSAHNFPARLRVLLSATIAVLLSPFLPSPPVAHGPFFSLLRFMGTEVCVGLLLGFICRMVFFALDAAGNVVATEMGLMLSTEFNQFSGAQSSPMGMSLYWMALMLWFSMDMHHWMIAALQRSYTLVPAGGGHLSQRLLGEVLTRTGDVFLVAVQIAAPVMGVSFVLALVFSLLGRAVPQMNVFTESFAIRSLVGLFIFGSTCLFMAQHIVNYLRRLPEDVLRVTQLVGSG